MREAGIKVCSGGIVGMGEEPRGSRRHAGHAGQPARASGERADQHADPHSGTPLAEAEPVDPIEFVRTIALARIMMPKSTCACRPAAPR